MKIPRSPFARFSCLRTTTTWSENLARFSIAPKILLCTRAPPSSPELQSIWQTFEHFALCGHRLEDLGFRESRYMNTVPIGRGSYSASGILCFHWMMLLLTSHQCAFVGRRGQLQRATPCADWLKTTFSEFVDRGRCKGLRLGLHSASKPRWLFPLSISYI